MCVCCTCLVRVSRVAMFWTDVYNINDWLHFWFHNFRARIKSYSKNVSTGNLIRHLREDHGLREEGTGGKQSIKNLFTTTPRPSTSVSVNKREPSDKWFLARDLALWFCRSLMPFNSVSYNSLLFKKHSVIGSTEDLPSRTTIAGTALNDIYESCLVHVKDTILLDASNCGAITFDLWSDQYWKQNYITFFFFHIKISDFVLHLGR